MKQTVRTVQKMFVTELEIEELGLFKCQTLRNMRWSGDPDGPPFYKLGKKKIVYKLTDLKDWLAKRRIDPGQK